MTSHQPHHPKKDGFNTYAQELEEFLELYLVKKAPALPDGVKEFLVTIAPWLAIIGVILTIPLILAALGVGSFITSMGIGMGMMMGQAYGMGLLFTIQMMILTIVIIIEIIAIPGLFHRQKKSWTLLFYATILQFISSLFYLTVGSILGTLIALYILFQVKSKYTK